MRQPLPVEGFFDDLMTTTWFRETVDLYFEGNYRTKYDEIIGDFLKRDILKTTDDRFVTTVTP